MTRFHDFKSKCWGKLVDLDLGGFYIFHLKCRERLKKGLPSTIDFDSEFISRFWVDVLKKINWPWPRLILWFQVKILRKISDFNILKWSPKIKNRYTTSVTLSQNDPSALRHIHVKIKDVWFWLVCSWPWPWIYFMILNLNILISWLPSTVELNLALITRFQIEILGKLIDLDPGWFYDFKLKYWRKLKMFEVDT